MVFRSIVLAVAALTLSTSVTAATITHNGYTLDTNTSIVTGNGLEWLQWDETLSYSINTAAAAYSADGWRVATNTDLAALFNSFSFGITFDTDENTQQTHLINDPLGAVAVADNFIEIFGNTTAGYAWNTLDGNLDASYALFGTDFDGDNLINTAIVIDSYQNNLGGYQSGLAQLREAASANSSTTYTGYGVALVRDVTVVPVPAAVWLFSSGLLGLIGIARRK